MLKKLRIKNFKSWKDTSEIEMAPITMFFGGNSSGKTSLLQFLLMLKQTSEAEDYSGQIFKFDGIVSLGNFKQVVYQCDKNNSIEFSISREVSKRSRFFDNVESIDAIVAEEDRKMVFKKIDVKEVVEKDIRGFSWKKRINQILDPKDKDGNEVKREIESFFKHGWSALLSAVVSKIYYIGPLRNFPERDYPWKNNYPFEVGKRGEFTIQTIVASNLKKENLESEVAKALKKMGLIESFKIKPIAKNRDDHYEVRVKKNKYSAEVLLPDVGFGVSQILPILTALYHSKEGAILLLEQPEIHLHPKAQIELADVIIEAVEKRKIQVIIESHSEHFLTRIQTRVADATISKEDAKLYFCKNEKGYSELELLKIEESGRITNWPPNFFGNMLEETSNRVMAFRNRKNTKN